MEKCTDTVVNWMIRCNAINEADKELYKYALYSFFLLVSPLILAGVIGFGLGLSLIHILSVTGLKTPEIIKVAV